MISDCKLQAMLLPLGTYRNSLVAEMKAGDELITSDDPACHLKVVSVNVIKARSSMANSLSMLLYDCPIELVLEVMEKNCGASIFRDKIIFVVYELDYTESFTQTQEEADYSMRGY